MQDEMVVMLGREKERERMRGGVKGSKIMRYKRKKRERKRERER